MPARYYLARAYFCGEGRKEDKARGLLLFKSAATAGHGLSSVYLGWFHLNGVGVPPDAEAAIRWFRKAGADGTPVGYDELGLAYAKGTGVAKDLAEAYKWYAAAGEAGNKEGLERQGHALLHGVGVAADPEAGIALVIRAIAKGNRYAVMTLGEAHIEGLGDFPASLDVGLAWYERAAELGYPLAARTVAEWYRTGGARVSKDPGQEIHWRALAAEQKRVRGKMDDWQRTSAVQKIQDARRKGLM